MKQKLTIDQRIEVARITASLFESTFPEFGRGTMKMSYELKIAEMNQDSPHKDSGPDNYRKCYAWLFDVVASKVTDESDSL
ncbi:TPA: hypothetical protein ACGQTK_002989 [Klebsiella quasipneumoniae]|uniref:hypothetical protein n=2 Tax=Klebsiella pneumoniae TaxID=573 RepID=UPI001258E4BA|nr:hypothetical protein [Klebsiella pneumoniae]EKT8241719.1 hypothetical protein [Klebsiella oxytoca]MCE0321802.1 hypothetical protein [Klebsiella pneumoniae]WMW97842.1 hypothetical protein RG051_09905 [Klebsiella pneumoniae]WRO69695.1 hypothetical protein VI609_20830 [Klebsiella pneumoniae]VAP78427.1 Uncharacterised protein [Klebsiella pneumoniae]